MGKLQRQQHLFVVNLDDTLTATRALVGSVVHLVKRNPWALFLLSGCLLAGRSRFKPRIAESSGFSACRLPWRIETGSEPSAGGHAV